MNYLEGFAWLGKQALSGLIFFWPVTLVLVIALLVTGEVAARKKHVQEALRSRLLWIQLIIPIFIITLGTLCARADRSLESLGGKRWAANLVFGFMTLELIITTITIFRPRAYRALAIALSAFMAWISAWATIVSLASITGNWL